MDKETVGIAVIMVALVAAMTLSGLVSAAPAGDDEYTAEFGTPVTNVSVGATNAARGGNITQADFTGIATQTSKWQGYYGNLSGSVTLGASDGTMKSWGWENESNTGYVLATPNSSIPDWINYDVAPSVTVGTVYGFGSIAVDRAGTTFNDNPISTTLVIAGKSHAVTSSNTVLTWNADASADRWQTTAFAYGSPVLGETQLTMFAGVNNATPSASAYNDIPCDYQMIVPVYEGAQTYYFYVELR
uniref:Uncharacterized protein n=1 Tax=Candidatus Methanogaster sp. ANME-2c ERB4 TaxID=2759911 RepID=A0A7G9Y6Y4_9EURY|nr:hypothetical protein PBPLAEBB_00003 [Methanosarcinales archaeon ANME-2c ERB4]QNO43859.1 hypothetical protein AGDLFKPD_00004 [Methanosarcinales archaeon ANME-2c ERB4]